MLKNALVTESGFGRDRLWDIHSRLMKDRIVFISGIIDDELSNTVVGQLLFLQKESSKDPITLYINSPGGYVTSGMAIYDTMRYVSCPVHTVCVGQAVSMGAVLLSSGTKGFRGSLENSTIMIHQPLGGASGQASDIIIEAKYIENVKNRLTKILSSNTGKDFEQVARDIDRNNYLDPEDALSYGLIDKVIKK